MSQKQLAFGDTLSLYNKLIKVKIISSLESLSADVFPGQRFILLGKNALRGLQPLLFPRESPPAALSSYFNKIEK
ncbi:hypothetical protein [Evansella clarkii]|uniref:hypothetical protein n=1 Tax=Evansella clarkii TaxID=79879 RepID=UPI001472AC7B|nr:hypothetical protein [Evansella clarkii]